MFKSTSSRLVLASTAMNFAGLCVIATDGHMGVGIWLLAVSLLLGVSSWFFASCGK